MATDVLDEKSDGDAALFALTNLEPHHDHTPSPAGATLLPSPLASLVSLAARSSSLYLSVGSFIGGLAIDGARITTLTTLELGRAVFEGILLRAGKDVAARSSGDLGKAEAEGLLERSIATLHAALTNASFLVATGFHVSAAALSSASALSLHVLSALDSILGSTESSRAIASIITLIRREFENPETGVKGERVGVVDLMVGISGLALLQRWCRRTTERELREAGADETVWDVVVLDNGRRADVIGVRPANRGDEMIVDALDTTDGAAESPSRRRPCSFIEMTGRAEVLGPLTSHDDEPSRRAPDAEAAEVSAWPENDIRAHIMGQLPANANVSVTTESVTTKTITVEVSGAEPSDIAPPPGVFVVEENAHQGAPDQPGRAHLPWYRIVYRTINNRLRSTTLEPADGPADMHRAVTAEEDDSMPPQYPGHEEPLTIGPPPAFHLSPYTSPDSDEHADTQAGYLTDYITSDDSKPSSLTAERPSKLPKRSSTPLGSQVNAANQKRARRPRPTSPPQAGTPEPEKTNSLHLKMSLPRNLSKSRHPSSEKVDKKEPSKSKLRKGTSITNLANIWTKESSPAPPLPATKLSKEHRPPWGSSRAAAAKKAQGPTHLAVASRKPNPAASSKALPQAPQRGNPNYFSSRDLGMVGQKQQPQPQQQQQQQQQDIGRSPSRASYFSVHERRRNSIVSQTDTYSIHSLEPPRPGSPSFTRAHQRPTSNLVRARSEKNVFVSDAPPASPARAHRRSKSFIPSIYTLATNNSETSLVRAHQPGRGAFDDHAAIMTLHHTGRPTGQFPQAHLVRNLTRYVRFASASYGSQFLRVMGLATTASATLVERDLSHHEEHHSFSKHTRLPPSTILLSSFVDPQGGSNAAGETGTGVPLVHYVSLDHDSKAVVLTCRGTLGFEDILTDMTCDYDDLALRGHVYRVHKGIHASARRLLHGGGGRVMATVKAALEEFPDYGFVLCGHSLGGGVAALLAIMISEPSRADAAGPAFVTLGQPPPRTPLRLTEGPGSSVPAPSEPIRLPAGRPVHVYAYGPPATVSPSLRLATRGLITTVVNGQDLVPHLSLGVLRDMQAVALAFKTDTSNAKGEVRSRVWEGLSNGFTERVYGQQAGLINEEDDQWAYAALKGLRASMLSPKLLPPGEVFVVETQRVLQRDAFTPGDNTASFTNSVTLGRPATRAVLKYVRDVERRFGEIRFGSGMLGDHSPGRYELSLAALGRGVLDERT
ncbi:MAG: hypothetical protein M1832_002724 [Thelocarpon impressellum]|nr:MAG: hypothetical protein M1832_002724 [Thelocarpon impressellum]